MPSKVSLFSTTVLQIRAARDGDAAAADALFTRYAPKVRQLVERRLGGELRGFAQIDDVLQESMLDAYRGIEDFKDEGDGRFIQWLTRIVENNICDLRRRLQPRKQGLAQMPEPSSSSSGEGLAARAREPSPSEIARGDELAQVVEQALARVHPTYRKIILLREMRGLSYEEIAKELGYEHAKTARVKLSIAKTKLRREMEIFAPSYLGGSSQGRASEAKRQRDRSRELL
jgi:RNA polymerase sigma-70 factor (ECF subfamily)